MSSPVEGRPAPEYGGEAGLHLDPAFDADAASAYDEDDDRSLLDDVHALFEDGRTYLTAELTYQKTRAAFVADRLKMALVLGAMAIMLGSLALIGLTVGLIIALTPILTAWGASALVVALLLLGAALAARGAAARWNNLMSAIQGDPKDGGK